MENSASLTVDSMGRKTGTRVFHDAMKVVVGHLQEFKLRGFVLKIRELIKWNGMPLVV